MTLSLLQRVSPLLLAVVLLGTSACESSRRERFAAQLEEQRKSIPPMEGRDTFADGQLTAIVSLGSGLGGLPGARGRVRSGKGFNPKFMGVHAGGGDYSGIGGSGEPNAFGFGPAHEVQRGEIEELEQPRLGESPMPPVTMVLDVENTSQHPLEIEFLDFTSEMGDFAVRPDKLTLAPGESGHSEPMTSRLGLTSYELPVTVRLKINGQSERKIITLKPVPAPAAPQK